VLLLTAGALTYSDSAKNRAALLAGIPIALYLFYRERWIFRLIVALVVVGALTVLGARFHDGPLGPLPGGSFASGSFVTAPVADWSFAADVPEIEMQLDSQSKSRTTWILVHEGRAYIPCSTHFPPGKTWHTSALTDGRATLRIAGKRYPVTLQKIDDPAVLSGVRDVAARKYPSRPGGDVWLFQVTSRNSASR